MHCKNVAIMFHLVCRWCNYSAVGFEDLTAAVMKSSVFWNITPCSQLKVNRGFGETCHLNLQGRRMSRARNELLSRHILRPWIWRQNITLECLFTFNGPHGVISQKTELFSCSINSEARSRVVWLFDGNWERDRNSRSRLEITTKTPAFVRPAPRLCCRPLKNGLWSSVHTVVCNFGKVVNAKFLPS
jgi:hypothetical protein